MCAATMTPSRTVYVPPDGLDDRRLSRARQRRPPGLGGSEDQTVDRGRNQPGRHAGFAVQPHGPVWSPDHVAGKGLDGRMLGLHSLRFTTEPSSNDTIERNSTVVDVPGLASPVSGTGRPPLMFDVIIAGCGPTGAMLAAELRLHDVRVLVLEKETEPVSFVRIVGLHIRSIELMAMRGLLERVLERGRQRPSGGFFAAITKPAPEGLDSAHTYVVGIPQPAIVHLLEEHAIELGAHVRRDCAVSDQWGPASRPG